MINTKSKQRVELAVHTCYSMKQGIGRPYDFIMEAKKLGMSAMAITDVGNISGFGECYEVVKNTDFKCIYGIDALVMLDFNLTETDASKNRVEDVLKHITILVRNEMGRKNLYHLLSVATNEYRYKDKWYIPEKLLKQYKDGLLLGGSDNLLIENLFDYVEIRSDFGRDEIQRLLENAEQHNVIPVVISVPFYPSEEYQIANDVLNLEYPEYVMKTNCYLQATNELLDRFSYLGKEKAEEIIIDNTNLIADMCELTEIISRENVCSDLEEMNVNLEELCWRRMKELYLDEKADVKKRLQWELAAIRKTSSSKLFLALKEILKKKKIDASLMAARSCMNNSLVAFLLGLTEINPVQENLSPYFYYGYFGEIKPSIGYDFAMKERDVFI